MNEPPELSPASALPSQEAGRIDFIELTSVAPDPLGPADRPEPAPAPASVPSRRRRGDLLLLFVFSLSAAILASAVTVTLVRRPVAPDFAIVAPPAAATSGDALSSRTVAIVPGPASPLPVIPVAALRPARSDAAIAAAAAPAVVTIETTTSLGSGSRSISGSGLGSGFIYAADGYILTAAHVIEGASAIKVTFADGRQFPATVVASDLATDVAVLHVVATGLPVISLGESAALAVGQTVLTIGDPLGAYPSSVTAGIISGLARTVTVPDELTGRPRTLTGMIQTDAAINSGNSGGPLLDASGAAIGLISATAAGSQNIGFATPIAAAQSVIANVHTT